MSAADLLGFLLSERPSGAAVEDAAEFWRSTRTTRDRFPEPIDWALAGGFSADRLAGAFVSGYQAALRVLFPSLDIASMAALCVTEESGNHPRAIRTTLETHVGERIALRGKKRWSTLGPLADVLFVVATTGSGDDGRPRLRSVAVPRGAPGLAMTPMPPTPFVPEVPHAELTLDGVELPASSVLAGDGYAEHVKPFRTIEDVHVQAAVLGYLMSVAVRYGFPIELRERLLALVAAIRAVA